MLRYKKRRLCMIESFFSGLDGIIAIMLIVLSGFIGLLSIVSITTNVVLTIKYLKYNNTLNSAGLTGEEVARKILDKNGLEDVAVSTSGAFLFGNSYSHRAKKVRIRNMTTNTASITALAMGSQKASLAIMDKNGDPAMKARVALTPLVVFGPLAFIPLVLIGFVVDIFLLKTNGIVSVVIAFLALLFYLVAIIAAIIELKTEKKAQNMAREILAEENLATEDELEQIKSLYTLYNIQYINDIILAMLEILYYVLKILAIFAKSSSKKK